MIKYVVDTFSVTDSQAVAIVAIFYTSILVVTIFATIVKVVSSQKIDTAESSSPMLKRGYSIGDFLLGWLSGALCLVCSWGLVNLFL